MNKTDWLNRIELVCQAIPAEWVLTDSEGGTWILPQYQDRTVVQLYVAMLRMGAANGWIETMSSN